MASNCTGSFRFIRNNTEGLVPGTNMMADQLPVNTPISDGSRILGKTYESLFGAKISRADTTGRHNRDHFGMHYLSAREVGSCQRVIITTLTLFQ